MIDILLILRGFSELVKTFTNYFGQMRHDDFVQRFFDLATASDTRPLSQTNGNETVKFRSRSC